MFHATLRRLAYVDMPVMAQPMIAWLKSQGIDATLASDDAGGLNPALAFSNGTWLLVREEQLAQAKILHAQYERSMTLIDHTFPSEDEVDEDADADDDRGDRRDSDADERVASADDGPRRSEP